MCSGASGLQQLLSQKSFSRVELKTAHLTNFGTISNTWQIKQNTRVSILKEYSYKSWPSPAWPFRTSCSNSFNIIWRPPPIIYTCKGNSIYIRMFTAKVGARLKQCYVTKTDLKSQDKTPRDPVRTAKLFHTAALLCMFLNLINKTFRLWSSFRDGERKHKGQEKWLRETLSKLTTSSTSSESLMSFISWERL